MMESLSSDCESSDHEYKIVSTQGVLNDVGRRNDITQGWEFYSL